MSVCKMNCIRQHLKSMVSTVGLGLTLTSVAFMSAVFGTLVGMPAIGVAQVDTPSLQEMDGPKITAPVVSQPQIVTADTKPKGPTLEKARDKLIAMQVCELLRSEHLNHYAVNEMVGQAAVDVFLSTLDPMKGYFYKSDAEAFRARSNEIIQTATQGDLKFPVDVFGVFLQRVSEKETMIREILQEPFEFDSDEEYMYDREDEEYPETPEEAKDLWRKRLKYEYLAMEADRESDYRKEVADAEEKGEPKPEMKPLTPEDEPLQRLERRYSSFYKRTERTTPDELLEMYLCAIMSVYDPHTSYMSPATQESFEVGISLGLKGIGASLRFVDGYTVVEDVLAGGPAAKDGQLKKGDKLIAVGDGSEGPMTDVVDMRLADVVQKIRGEIGTHVRILIQSSNGDRKTLDLVRDEVPLVDSRAKDSTFICGQKSNGAPYRVGLIRLASFYRDMEGAQDGNVDYTSATHDVAKILERFNNENVDAVILDLRSNGGGVLEEAIELTGLFIVDGPVAQLRDAKRRIRVCPDEDPAILWSKPVIMMIDKLSASATEIFVGAMQDMKRGIVVGDEATHGKGTVQRLISLSERIFPAKLGAAKITMQQFYCPSGRTPQLSGIPSDIQIPSLTTHLDIGESDLKYPVPQTEIPSAEFKVWNNYVTPEILTQLREKAKTRQEKSPYFQQVNKVVNNYLEQKAKKSVSLNREKFMADRAEVDAASASEKQIEKLTETEGSIKKDAYIEEVLAIMADYLQVLRQ
ncbi:MAG: carboxy terminal-processing peptidase [Thermoguttaceae bacterium]|nr:carboxy terminal-processing peptidase [Thermoguttaceae bacterium]